MRLSQKEVRKMTLPDARPVARLREFTNERSDEQVPQL
jgi:hypothetical protein